MASRGFLWACAVALSLAACRSEPPPAALTAEERSWLAQHPLRFAPDPAFPPIEWIDEQGRYQGLVADYFRLIETRLATRIEIVREPTWEVVLEKAKAREVDGITAAQPTEERSRYLLFSPPIIDVPNVVIVPKGVSGDHALPALAGHRVAVTEGNALHEYLRTFFPQIVLVPVRDDLTCLTEVSFGRVDATVVNLAIASYLIERHGITNLRVAADSGRKHPLVIATRSDQPVLQSIMTKALASVTPAEREEIRARWIRIDTGPVLSHRLLLGLWAAVSTAAFLTLLAVGWSYSLRRKVAAATSALQSELAERRRAEAALRASQTKLTLHLEQSLVGVLEIDPQFRIVYWNTAAERIFGWPASEVLGSSAERILPEPSRAANLLVWKALLEGKGGRYSLNENRVRDGGVITCEWFNSLLVGEQGEATGVMSLVLDVSDRVRREEAQTRAQRLESLAVLAGGIAHDFNNLLTGILGNISLAVTDDPPRSEQRQLLGEAEKAALRAQDLTRQLLTFSRGGAPLKTLLALPRVVLEAAQFAAHGASGACRFELPDDCWPVEGDGGQLGQVVQNLVLNALEAQRGGTVEVSLANLRLEEPRGPLAAGSWVRLRVADHGQGIPAEDLPRIFDPFFSTKRRGSGLGLAVTHSIVARHAGHVEVCSVRGEGTTLDVFLPARPGERLASASAAVAPASDLPARILLMDDEEAVRRLGQRVFEGAGWGVAVAADGAEAVAKYRSEREAGQAFDVVILDLTVPGRMGGVETLRALKVLDPQVKAIVSSGYSNAAEMSEHLAHGFVAVIAKPWTVAEARRVVREVLAGAAEAGPAAR
ncbi:MAG TPA: transporter substrate-binding domain-containing protein [Myxococcales bacterium]|jgi:PAS domain S-box-containing protein